MLHLQVAVVAITAAVICWLFSSLMERLKSEQARSGSNLQPPPAQHSKKLSTRERFKLFQVAYVRGPSRLISQAESPLDPKACEKMPASALDSLRIPAQPWGDWCGLGGKQRQAIQHAILSGDAASKFHEPLPAWLQPSARSQRAEYKARNELAMTVDDVHAAIRSTCEPVLRAALECLAAQQSAGAGGKKKRKASAALNADAPLYLAVMHNISSLVQLALDHSSLIGERQDGWSEDARRYLLFDATTPGRTIAHVAALLGRRHILELIEAARPKLAKARDALGVRPRDLLVAPVEPRERAPINADPMSDSDDDSGADGDTGGWPRDGIRTPGGGYTDETCDIETVSGESVRANASGFVKRFVLSQRPVMVRNLRDSDDALGWYSQAWRRASLLRKYGAATVDVGAIPYSEVFTGKRSRRMTLREYVSSAMPHAKQAAPKKAQSTEAGTRASTDYVFLYADSLFSQVHESADELPNPQWVQELSPYALGDQTFLVYQASLTEFYLGAPGSGAPFHTHAAAWNYLAHGRKLWALTPPAEALVSVQPAHRLFFEELDSLPKALGVQPPRMCVQRAGDLLVLPWQWGHATLNLRSSVGIAREFRIGVGRAA